MKLIDIDAFRKDLGLAERCEECERGARECQYDQIYTRMDFCGWLDDAEIIDAVPVVRCKDCAIAQHDELFGQLYCNGKEVKPDGYCSDGERRTDDA